MSNSSTGRWNSDQPPPQQGNKAGECFDCYYGTFNRESSSSFVKASDTSRSTINMGLFPMDRYMSLCSMTGDMFRITNMTGLAFKQKEVNNWGYGELEGKKSRSLSLHSNCINFLYETATPFHDKELFFRSMNSWVLGEKAVMHKRHTEQQ